MAQLSPYSDFQAMTPGQLSTLQVKLTFVGFQEKPVQTVVFTSPTNTVDVGKFAPFQQPGINYANDNFPPVTFSAAPTELQAVIQEAGKVPAVMAGGVAAEPYISFSLFNIVGGVDKAFEVILNQTDGIALFQALRTALAGNRTGLLIVYDMGCQTALREPGQPLDVTSKVSISLAGTRLNRATGRFVGTATVKNVSPDSIPGPVSLVLYLESEGNTVRLFNADGYTCSTSPEGHDFINLPLTGNQFSPQASAEVTLEFINSERVPVRAETKVLAGPGGR
jgi:hypothetical protein